MTSDDLSRPQDPNAEAEADEPRYAVQPSLIEARGQSVAIVLGERLCEAARAKLKSPDAWRSMTFREIRKLMKDNCSGQEGNLEPQQPILETVVRVLLSARADNLSLSEIHDELSDLWVTAPWPRHVSAEALQRVLDNATHCGIART